ADEITYTTDGLSVRVQRARFTLPPRSLLALSPRIVDPGAERIEVATKPSDGPRSPLPDSIALPVEVSIHNARIGVLVLDDAARVVELRSVHLEYAGGARRHEVKELDFTVSGHAVALRGTVDTQKPFELKAHVAAVRPAGPELTVAASVTGSLARLRFDAHARSGKASARATGTVRPDEPQPLDAVEMAVHDLDPHAIDARLPQARI